MILFFYSIMASMDSHFHRSILMEIVCYSLSYRGTSFQYSLIQLYLSLVEIGNLYLNLGWTFYIVRQRRKEYHYNLFDVCKSRVLNYKYAFTIDEYLSADKIVLRHSFKGMTGIFTMINILVTEENIVNDFLIQFPCW